VLRGPGVTKPRPSSAPIALVDGDIIAYRCCSAGQQNYDWGDTGGKVAIVDPEVAVEAALKMILEWVTLAGCRDPIVALSGANNFRKRILPTYKANRKAKPEALPAVLAAMEAEFITQKVEGLEADDILGILATTDRYIDRSIVVTIDKDLMTVPGVHFNPMKSVKPVRVDLLQADYWWLIQTLMGDPVDGYTGIPGVGIKGAQKILGGASRPGRVEKLWPYVVAAYKQRGLTEADALIQARVARILRRSDYDKETKEIVLWHPTTPLRIPVLGLLSSTLTGSNPTTCVEQSAA